MDDFVARVWQDLGGRIGGPLTFRLFIQPIVAIVLAVRAGLNDSRGGRPPYLWAVVTDSAHRQELLRNGWKDLARLFVLAIVIDLVYQLIVFRWIYPLESLIVAVVLALVPYLVIRGPMNRLAQHRHPKPAPRGPAR